MNILFVLIPVTTLIILVGVAMFFWAVNHRQFDDLESPAVLPLLEDTDPLRPAPAEGTPASGTDTASPDAPPAPPDAPDT